MEPDRLEKTAVSEVGEIANLRFRFADRAWNSQWVTRSGAFYEKTDHTGLGDR